MIDLLEYYKITNEAKLHQNNIKTADYFKKTCTFTNEYFQIKIMSNVTLSVLYTYNEKLN